MACACDFPSSQRFDPITLHSRVYSLPLVTLYLYLRRVAQEARGERVEPGGVGVREQSDALVSKHLAKEVIVWIPVKWRDSARRTDCRAAGEPCSKISL